MIADDIRKLAVQHDYRSALVKLHDCTVLLRLTLIYIRLLSTRTASPRLNNDTLSNELQQF